MTAPARLGLYGLVLAVVFALSAAIANAVVPEETVRDWVEHTEIEHTEVDHTEVEHTEDVNHDNQ